MEYYQLADWSKVMGHVRRETIFFSTGCLTVSKNKEDLCREAALYIEAFAYSSMCQIILCQGHASSPPLSFPATLLANWLCCGFKADISLHLHQRATGLVKVMKFRRSCLGLWLLKWDTLSATSLSSLWEFLYYYCHFLAEGEDYNISRQYHKTYFPPFNCH